MCIHTTLISITVVMKSHSRKPGLNTVVLIFQKKEKSSLNLFCQNGYCNGNFILSSSEESAKMQGTIYRSYKKQGTYPILTIPLKP